MKVLYNIVIFIYTGIIKVVSLFNHKANLWVLGREDWYRKLDEAIGSDSKYVWIHCASLGEFEQGRPLIEKMKLENPETRILLTFFSPSGYEIQKHYSLADYICYLPADTPMNANKFVERVSPEFVIFIKYEFWNNYITELGKNKIPLYLVSGIFRKDQVFFRWYGGFFRKLLRRFTHIFVQNQDSLELLRQIGILNVTMAGDTRFDRVRQITASAKELPVIEKFRGNEKLFLAGSSWKPDEEIIVQYINSYPDRMKWIFAPHEIDNANIDRLTKLLKVKTVRYSDFEKHADNSRVMIIDNIGMLSSVYRYAFIAAIGGGFGRGIHNILEPAGWSLPVVFGPNWGKFREAEELISKGGARSFNNYYEFESILNRWLSDTDLYLNNAGSAGDYVIKNTGATCKITGMILQKDINMHCS